jgi:hypothetical protein
VDFGANQTRKRQMMKLYSLKNRLEKQKAKLLKRKGPYTDFDMRFLEFIVRALTQIEAIEMVRARLIKDNHDQSR